MKLEINDFVRILPNKGVGTITNIDSGFYILDNNEVRPYIAEQLELIGRTIQSKYMAFKLEKLENKKTYNVKVLAKSNLTVLGEIKWYAPWRKYCFFTVEEYQTVFDSNCLNEIDNVIKQLYLDRIAKE
jgi:hypothetical protein